jgi:large conductance mechanosensitive channel
VIKEFKAFLMKGNVLDLAVGIIIGAAFGKIVSSFVTDILTPIISIGLGKVDFSNLFIALNGESYETLEAAKKAGAATVNIGLFTNAVIDFVIVGFAIFLVVKLANKYKTEPKPVAPNTKECPECLSVIPLRARKCSQCSSPQSI